MLRTEYRTTFYTMCIIFMNLTHKLPHQITPWTVHMFGLVFFAWEDFIAKNQQKAENNTIK